MEPAIRVAGLAPSRGAAWLVEAFALFRRKPLAWIAISVGWVVITVGLIMVPLVGGVVANFLQPVFFASFAIAAYRQSAGEDVVMNDLFRGFKRNLRPLVQLGALLLVAEILIFILMAALGLPTAPEGNKTFTVREYVEVLQGKEWILAVGFILTVLVKGALWFAPPLIAFHDLTMSHAIRWSLYAAVENIGAMLLYALALFALFLLAMIPLYLGLLVAIPVMAISTFVGYREVFEAGAKQPPAPGAA